ncbi:MAG: alpha-amylase family glycosyl hydrolase [Flexilinea sp.]
MMEFHVSHQSRKRYQFDLKMFSYDGNVIFADFMAAREFAQKINDVRMRDGNLPPVYPGVLNALGLIDEILHMIIDQYRKEINPELNSAAYIWLEKQLGQKTLDETLEAFCIEFPPVDVYQGKITVRDYLSETNPKGKINRYEIIEEILLLWITNRNPAAMNPFGELFDEKNLTTHTAYSKVIFELNNFFQTLPKIENMTLIEYLRAPAIAHPDSLFDQLDFIRIQWAVKLGEFLRRMLRTLDWMKEEGKEHGFGGPGPVEIPVYTEDAAGMTEFEAFSEDREWMPRLVLMAKNTYVWLDQLSKKYGYLISKLNEIPDEELRNLRDEGFTGLWLIGLWERSKASASIKQYCGNPEAIASAYSLADYLIADDLGGENAYEELKYKAWRFGIRLASDMVPNHMGIDSNWVINHPDRFLSLPYSPFPSYTFNGPNLSPEPQIGIYIEDHYYTRQDAAVVFQRVDYNSGNVRYIYHGNDGTSMPWNDTAQLNYLNPEVREAVIQTILQVAKRFPIIRFDAAMTLAKKHYQRLWFPEPGTGGDIATRSEFGLNKSDFDQAFPVEFWREVVDRVAAEAPDTLLLAEAFWMMEGYFVRTLGMHRVYNSAFMNLLRNEDNVQYRILLKTTLEYDPDILKRYVNFMNNPDEKTAVEQFGKGDKYFGICVLMATMPGLPMFGHGQIEGFSEKYGMEYRKAYWDERVDQDLLHRHEREIFPLLHQRRRFAEVSAFVLYNFATAYGNIDENVFAYSNYGEGRHNLVIYHNRYGDTRGFIRQSVPFMVKDNSEKHIEQHSIAESFGLHDQAEFFTVMYDTIRGLNYIFPSKKICEEGLYFELHAYQYYVFNEVYEVQDDTFGTWRKLCTWLAGNGTPDVTDSIQEITLHFVLEPYRNCFDGNKLRWLQSKIGFNRESYEWTEIKNGTWPDFEKLTLSFNACYELDRPLDGLFTVYSHGIGELLTKPDQNAIPAMQKYNAILEELTKTIEEKPYLWNVLLIGLQEQLMAKFGQSEDSEQSAANILDDWQLRKTQNRLLHEAGWYEISISDQIILIHWLYQSLDRIKKWSLETLDEDLDRMLLREDIQRFLKVNLYEGIRWFNKESAEELSKLLFMIGYYEDVFDAHGSAAKQMESVLLMKKAADMLEERIKISDFHYALLISGKTSGPKDELQQADVPEGNKGIDLLSKTEKKKKKAPAKE